MAGGEAATPVGVSNTDATDMLELFRLNATFSPTSGLFGETRENSADSPYRRGRQSNKLLKWRRVKSLWNGSSATVWLEELESSHGSRRAVKEIPKQLSLTKTKSNYHAELLAHCQISRNKDHFVEFFGWFESPKNIYLVTEYLPLGDLERNAPGALPEREASLICSQLAAAVEILHSRGWTHRDLKPKNVYVFKTAPAWWVKIGDFGISKRRRFTEDRMSTMVGTPNFAAPETIPGLILETDEEDSVYTEAVDLWSLGALTFALCVGYVPFPSFRELQKYCSNNSVFPSEALWDKNITGHGTDFLKSLLNPDPVRRLSASEALQHPWLKEGPQKDVLENHDTLIDLAPAPEYDESRAPMLATETAEWNNMPACSEETDDPIPGVAQWDSSSFTDTTQLFSRTSSNADTGRSSQKSTPHPFPKTNFEENFSSA